MRKAFWGRVVAWLREASLDAPSKADVHFVIALAGMGHAFAQADVPVFKTLQDCTDGCGGFGCGAQPCNCAEFETH